MKKSRFSEHQIITILKSVEAGRTAKDVCREHGISSATFYTWKSKFGGMEASDIRRKGPMSHWATSPQKSLPLNMPGIPV